MMFSATMTSETRALCKKFMTDPHEISVDQESKLTLHGLLQYYVKLTEKEKNRKLNDLLDALEFNQVVIFVKSVQRAVALDKLLTECNFPSIAIHLASTRRSGSTATSSSRSSKSVLWSLRTCLVEASTSNG